MESAGVFVCWLVVSCACLSLAQSPWPFPQQMTTASGTYSLNPSAFSFNFESTDVSDQSMIYQSTNVTAADIMAQAFKRYQQYMFSGNSHHNEKHVDQSIVALNGLSVKIVSSSVKLQYDTDESYSLAIVAPTAHIQAQTVYGALRGLETFSQFVFFNNTVNAYVIQSAPVHIIDAPRFIHRGLLVDTARHFQPVQNLLRSIDALAFNKMNVLHWHVTDAESFPMTSNTYPRLTKGAYSPEATYSHADVQQVVLYGLYRGVRVVPEFDTPGHSNSWGAGYPTTTAKCPGWSQNINNVPLNPAVNLTFDILNGFIGEMSELFLDEFLHIGGDEVVFGCWAQDSILTAWMQKNGITSYTGVMQYYEKQLWAILQNNNKRFIAWEEVFSSYGLTKLPPGIIIMVWKDEPTLLSVAQASLQGLLSYGWYLDNLQLKWQDFYLHEPFQSSQWTPKLQSYILGGEVSAWGEQVSFANLDQTIWPRGAATAERLWSPQDVTDTVAAQPRLIDHICRLNKRGIMSAPIVPGYCA